MSIKYKALTENDYARNRAREKVRDKVNALIDAEQAVRRAWSEYELSMLDFETLIEDQERKNR